MEVRRFDEHVAEFWIKTKSDDLEHAAFGLLEESGEVAGKLKRLYRGDSGASFNSPTWKGEVIKELGDTLYYLTKVAHLLGYTLEDVATINIEKLQDRRNRCGTMLGSGDNR